MPFPIQNPFGLDKRVAGLDPGSAIIEDYFLGGIINAPGQALLFTPNLTAWQYTSFWNTEEAPLVDYNGLRILVNHHAFVSIVAEVVLSDPENPGDYAAITMVSPDETQNQQGGKCAFVQQGAICSWRGRLSPYGGNPWQINVMVGTESGTQVQTGGHFSMTASPMPF